ncbi:MAG: hypothetical protein Q9169_002441 [Polycauliona sp. 2 TL-2023]
MRSALLAGATLALTVGQALAGVQYAGVNIAGFDFGCTTNGACNTAKVVPPLHEYKGKDGAKQMQHFVKDGGLNAFRLPVAWQYLAETPGAPLNPANLKIYDALVKECLATGSLCIIDIHNYARWDGKIIGQGGPTDEEFADLWSQLATQYKSQSKVVMGIVNEPHESNGYTSAGTFVSSGSAKALASVKDADGSTDKLIFEVHKYLDEDNSGTHLDCVSNNIDAFEDLTAFLKENKRQALLAETGGGPTESCLTNVCELLSYLNENDDVYMGYLGWGAGSFDDKYELSLTPVGGDGDAEAQKTPMTDVPLMTECFIKQFSGGAGTGGSFSGSNSTTGGSTPSNSSSSETSSDDSSASDESDGPTAESSNSTPGATAGGSTADEPSSSTPQELTGDSASPGGGQTSAVSAETDNVPGQGTSTGSQESTPGGAQEAPGSGGGSTPVALKGAQHQVAPAGNTDLGDANIDEGADDECAADEVEEDDNGANEGTDDSSPDNTPTPGSTSSGTSASSSQDQTGMSDLGDTDQSTEGSSPQARPSGIPPTSGPNSSSTVASKSSQHQVGESNPDVNNEDENEDDEGVADEGADEDECENEESPEPTVIPRPSSTFATSYIPTPSATHSPGMNGSYTGGSSSPSIQNNEGSDMGNDAESYA